MTEMSISSAIAELARRDPHRAAVHDLAADPGPGSDPDVAAGTTLSRRQLHRASTRLARAWLARADVAVDDRVAVVLGNGAGFVVACVAVWTLGATPVPMSPTLAADDRDAVLAAAGAVLVVDADDPDLAAVLADPDAPDAGPALPDVWASAWKAPASGGSTGRPKIVVSTGPARVDPDAAVAPYLPPDQVQLVSGPLHHSAPFTYALRGLMTGHTLVVLPRFDPRAVLAAIARHRVTWALLVPAMMHRIARLPADERTRADLTSLATLVHLGAPCPPAVKRTWLEWLGPDRVVEVYASSESAGITMIRGDEWLARPGSVGRGVGGSEFRVVADDGTEQPAGEVGEVVMTRPGGPRYRYLGAEPRRVPGWDGWDALGDLGWLDADGYLYLVDREADTVTVDGTTVYPARVEAVLEAHPAVRTAVVIGVPGAAGERVHALLDLDGDEPPEAVLAHAADHLPPEQVPASAEVVDAPLRDDAGKVNRRALRAARARPPAAGACSREA